VRSVEAGRIVTELSAKNQRGEDVLKGVVIEAEP
jgi:hypothetical protein